MKKIGFGIVTQGGVNRNVRSIKSTRKSSYTKYTSKHCFQIVKYANKTFCSVAARKFKSLFADLNEIMVRGFQKKYLDQVKLSEKRKISEKVDSPLATWKAITSRQ